jgi:hypothetical protein
MTGTQFHFNMELTAEGIAKRNAMRRLPAANKRMLTKWMSETVKEAMASAASMQKAGKGKKTSQMGRNVGMTVDATESSLRGLIGTGVGGRQTVKYASIQDKGDITHPTVTPRLRRWAWAMFYETKLDKYKWIALTKKLRLTVPIPESKWFSGVIDRRKELLDFMMSPAVVFDAAMRMGSN